MHLIPIQTIGSSNLFGQAIKKQIFSAFYFYNFLKNKSCSCFDTKKGVLYLLHGRVAQLGECCIRIAEVEGSTPFASTKYHPSEQFIVRADFSYTQHTKTGDIFSTFS